MRAPPEVAPKRAADPLGMLGHGLFLGVFAFYWITLTPFVDLTGAAVVDPVAGNSNALNQLVALALFGGLLLFFLIQRRGVRVFGPAWLLTLLLSWALVTSATALHPDLAIKRLILIGMIICNAGIVLVLPRTEADFARLSALVIGAVLAMSYFGIVFRPTLAIHQASEILEPMNAGLWRGIFAHKNSAAAAMVLAVFFGLFIARVRSRLVGWTMVILAAFFLSRTGGKSAALILPAILVLGWVIERFAWTRLPLILGGLIAFNVVAVGASVSEPLREFISSLGIDATFTNRSDIWRFAFEAISDRPILGHGFQSFWQTDALVYSGSTVETWAAVAYNGHNGYIDTMIDMGVPGLILTVIWLVILPIRDLGRAQKFDNSPAMTRLFTRVWLYTLVLTCLESTFYQGGGALWFCLLFSIFGLRLQGSARLVPTRAASPAQTMVVGYA